MFLHKSKEPLLPSCWTAVHCIRYSFPILLKVSRLSWNLDSRPSQTTCVVALNADTAAPSHVPPTSSCEYCVKYSHSNRKSYCAALSFGGFQHCCGRLRSWWKPSVRQFSEYRRELRKETSTASPSSSMRFSTAPDCSAVAKTTNQSRPRVSLAFRW